MASRIYRSRLHDVPQRDSRCGTLGQYQTLEEAVRAFFRDGVVNLPEAPEGSFEFDTRVSADALRGEDIAPTSIDRMDIAAEISAKDYSAIFGPKDTDLAPQPAEEPAAPSAPSAEPQS